MLENMAPDFRLSELRQVVRHLSLELWEVPRNLRHVEASENRFLRLTIEQEPEGCFEAALRRVFARRQPFAQLSRHRDVVTRLALSLGDDHIESEGIALGGEPDLDHVALLAARVRDPDLPRIGTVAVGTAFDGDKHAVGSLIDIVQSGD